MLDQVAAGSDVEQLHATADAEQRQPAAAGLEQQRELERVAALLLLAGLGMRLGRSIQVDAEVGAADQEQPVDRIEHLARLGGALGSRRQHQRQAAGETDAFDVARRHERDRQPPVRPARLRPVGREADPRTRHYKPLEAAAQLPVGDGTIELILLHVRGVQVVLDDLVPERLARQRQTLRAAPSPSAASPARADGPPRRSPTPPRAARARTRRRCRRARPRSGRRRQGTDSRPRRRPGTRPAARCRDRRRAARRCGCHRPRRAPSVRRSRAGSACSC